MKVVLAVGYQHKNISDALSGRHTVINARVMLTVANAADYMAENDGLFDVVIITDGGILPNPLDNRRYLEALNKTASAEVIVITSDFLLPTEPRAANRLSFVVNDSIMMRSADVLAIVDARGAAAPKTTAKNAETPPKKLESDIARKAVASEPIIQPFNETAGRIKNDEVKKTRLKLGGFKKKANDIETDDLPDISRALSKAVAFTGHRGAGVTGTAANVAATAANKGLSAVYVDLDTEFRAANLYFSKFCEAADEDEEVCRSLVAALARPQDYMTAAFALSDNLRVISLGYEYGEEAALAKFMTGQKIIGMISVLKNKFNFVAVDIPLPVLARFPETVTHFDSVALCVKNSFYSAVTTLKSLMIHFDEDTISYMNPKTKLITTDYNDESIREGEQFTPERLAELLTSGVCSAFTGDIENAGMVPHSAIFDRQIENDIPVCETDSLMNKAFSEICLALLS